MQVVNVIVIEGGVIQSVEAFIIQRDTNTDVAREAERVFVEHLKNIDSSLSKDEIDSALEAGQYVEEGHDYGEVHLIYADAVTVG